MTQRLSDALKRRAIAWAGQLTRLAKSFAPNHIKPYIRSRVETKDNGSFIIRTTVNRKENPLPKYGSMDARAQEYGSGEHSSGRGTKGKYPIRPKNRQALAFYEDANGTWDYSLGMPIRYAPDGRGLFFGVQHPGIKPYHNTGYIRPAIKELRARARKDLTKDVRDAILGDLRQAFGRTK